MNINVDILLSRLERLCSERNTTMNAAFVESGVGKNFKSNMKTANPSIGKITMLANYFGVSVDYLIGNSNTSDTPSSPKRIPALNEPKLSDHERKILFAYRNQPAMQPAVDRILGVTEDDGVLVYEAAKSSDNHPPQIVKRTKEEWNALKNAPETDEDLL